jgi:DNA-binding CsgD family transcriptional regulator
VGLDGSRRDSIAIAVISADHVVAERLRAALSTLGPCEVINRFSGHRNGGSLPSVAVWQVGSLPITSIPPTVPILGVGPDDTESMLEAIEAGANGYVDIASSSEELVEAAREVAAGIAFVSPLLLGPLLRAVVERRRREKSQRASLEILTPREREVFALAARGLTRSQIAHELTISPDTARTHLQKVMAKLDLHSHAELVAFAARCGLTIER